MNQPSQQSLRTDKSGLNYGYGQVQTERRTPDTYGRSAAKPRSARGNGDYEEVYGAPQLYQRPAGPVGYTKGSSPAPIPIPLYAQQHQQYQQQIHSPGTPSNSKYISSFEIWYSIDETKVDKGLTNVSGINNINCTNRSYPIRNN